MSNVGVQEKNMLVLLVLSDNTVSKIVQKTLKAAKSWNDNQEIKLGGKGKIVSSDHTFATYAAKYNRVKDKY